MLINQSYVQVKHNYWNDFVFSLQHYDFRIHILSFSILSIIPAHNLNFHALEDMIIS